MNPSILQVIGYSLETNTPRSPIDMKILALYTAKPLFEQGSVVAQLSARFCFYI